jgi:hypothetical protein
MSDYIEVGFYFCGVYQGKRKVGKNSVCGKLLSGDTDGGLNKVSEMIDEINAIPGVKAASNAKELGQNDRTHD